MPRTVTPSRSSRSRKIKNPRKSAGWGGKRKGAGRKRQLTDDDRQQISFDYYDEMQACRQSQGKRSRRKDALRKVADKWGISERMIARCNEAFLKETRQERPIWLYATKGMNEVIPICAQNIKKLEPGAYHDPKDKRLHLTIYSKDKRRWTFRFFWLKTLFQVKELGGSEMSLAEARKHASAASRMLVSGQNPIDGSWENPDLARAAALRAPKS